MILKLCTKCKTEKNIENFCKDKRRKDGRTSQCKNCLYEYQRKHHIKNGITYTERSRMWVKNNKEKSKKYHNNYWLKKKFGITTDEYNNMLEKQKGVCAICGKNDYNTRRMPVDHCHSTGKIRGILCHFCNRAIGLMKDDVSILSNAIKYLKS